MSELIKMPKNHFDLSVQVMPIEEHIQGIIEYHEKEADDEYDRESKVFTPSELILLLKNIT